MKRPGTSTVLRWELVKLVAQARSRWTLVVCAVAPAVVTVVLTTQQRPPKDTIYGRWVQESGFAVPLLLLAFASQWLLPLVSAIVGGDVFANEDGHGTWKTILTRSVSRRQVFVAKSLTALLFTTTAFLVLATSSIVSGIVVVGRQPLHGLSAQLIPPSQALPLVIESWATALPPLLAFTALAVLLSVASRNSSLGVAAPVVLGLLMTLLDTLGSFDLPRTFLLTTGFDSWHGLLTARRFFGPVYLDVAVSLGWTVVLLGAAYALLRRRDVTGG